MSTKGRVAKAKRHDGKRRAKKLQVARQLHAYARTRGIARVQGDGHNPDPRPTKRFTVVAHRMASKTTPARTVIVHDGDDESMALAFCAALPGHLREQGQEIPPGSYLVLRDREANTKRRFNL